MKNPCPKTRSRGVTFIEVLMAVLIIGSSVAALVQLWYFSFRITNQASNQSVAYSIARAAIEQVRESGFSNTAEGSTTLYYDAYGSFPPNTAQAAASVYSVTTTVTSDLFNGAAPADTALRSVTVTVKLLGSGQTVFQTNTALAKAGI